MDRLTALTVFREVSQLGSFAKASRRLLLSPAAISKNIGELEAHLGVRLFNRTTRRVSLTEAGSLYCSQIVRVLDDLDAADRALGALQQTPRGELRVSAPITVTLLTPLSRSIPKFLDRHPELSIALCMDDRRVNMGGCERFWTTGPRSSSLSTPSTHRGAMSSPRCAPLSISSSRSSAQPRWAAVMREKRRRYPTDSRDLSSSARYRRTTRATRFGCGVGRGR